MKKTLKFVLEIFWFIIVLLMPTAIFKICQALNSSDDSIFSFIFFLYSISIIFSVLIICIALFVWKKPSRLFVLPLGFLITLWLVPMVLSYEFDGFEQWVFGVFYSVPFATITAIIASIMAALSWDKKSKNPPEIHKTLPFKKSDDNIPSMKQRIITSKTTRVIVICTLSIAIVASLIFATKYEIINPSEIKVKTSQYLKEKYPDKRFIFLNKINSSVGGGEIFQGYTKEKYGVADYKQGSNTVRVVYTETQVDDYSAGTVAHPDLYDNLEVKKVETDLEKYIKSNFDDIDDIQLMVSDISLGAGYYWAGSYFKKDHLYHGNIETFLHNSDSKIACRIYVKDHLIDSDFEKKMDALNMKLEKLLGNGAATIEWFVGNKQDLEYFKEKYPMKEFLSNGKLKYEVQSSWYYDLQYETKKLDLIYIFRSRANEKDKYYCDVYRNGEYKLDLDFNRNRDPISYR